jgi:hypothetical protein
MLDYILKLLKIKDYDMYDLIKKNQALNVKQDKIVAKRVALQSKINQMISEKLDA